MKSLKKLYSKKLLNDLNDLSLWESDSIYTLRNKEEGFEIWVGSPENRPDEGFFYYWFGLSRGLIYKHPEIEFPFWAGYKIFKKAQKVKTELKRKECKEIKYFSE